MTKKKNGRIELLRFLFAIMILLFHIQKRFACDNVHIGSSGLLLFSRGYIGVEFFFLVSGYLLAASCYAKREYPGTLIGTETAGMMYRKVMSVFPYHIFATVITLIVNAYFLEKTFSGRFKYILDSWAAIFMVQVFGFHSSWVNTLTWYLDVWLMVTFIFYIFLRKNYDVFAKVVCPLLALFVLGYIDYTYGKISGVEVWTGLFYKCFLRGMSEMALGISAYSMTRLINKQKYTQAGKTFFAIVEAIGYIFVFVFSCTSGSCHYEMPVIFVMTVLIMITFSDINPCHEIFDHSVFGYMGKLSLLIYLNQFYAIRLVEMLLVRSSLIVKFMACIAITLIGSLICDFVVSRLSLKRIKKWFLVQ